MKDNKTEYKKPSKGDLVRRVTDGAKGIYLSSYRDYNYHMAVAQWPDDRNPISSNMLWVYCEEDNKWKGIIP